MNSMAPGELLILAAEILSGLALVIGTFVLVRRRGRKKQNVESGQLQQMFNMIGKLRGELNQLREDQCNGVTNLGMKAHRSDERFAAVNRRLEELLAGQHVRPRRGEVKDIAEKLRKERADAFTEFRRHMEQFVSDRIADQDERIAQATIRGVSEDQKIINKLRDEIVASDRVVRGVLENLLSDTSFVDRLTNRLQNPVKYAIAHDMSPESIFNMVKLTIEKHLQDNRQKIADIVLDTPLELVAKPRVQSNVDDDYEVKWNPAGMINRT